jgi:hypothetical protein
VGSLGLSGEKVRTGGFESHAPWRHAADLTCENETMWLASG